MKLDYRNYDNQGELEREYAHGKVLVDGREIKQVFYVDTEAGFVRSYDVLGDNKAHATCECLDPEVVRKALEGETEPWDQPLDGALSKYIRGVVELSKKQ